MSEITASKKYIEKNGSKGFLAVLKEFIDSVEALKHTVMFPVKLLDLDKNQLPDIDTHLQQFAKEGITSASQDDMYALYTLLLNASSEVLTGHDVTGRGVTGESYLGEHFKEVTETLNKMADLSKILKSQYEKSLRLSD